MNKLKIERGASKLRWVQLKTNVEESIAGDIDLMCRWSDNERKYIVNELLRFALAQSGDFQKYKSGLPSDRTATAEDKNDCREEADGAPGLLPKPDIARAGNNGRQ